jgi:hypothetical protein
MPVTEIYKTNPKRLHVASRPWLTTGVSDRHPSPSLEETIEFSDSRELAENCIIDCSNSATSRIAAADCPVLS